MNNCDHVNLCRISKAYIFKQGCLILLVKQYKLITFNAF